jgi:hypothetical protein
MKPGWTARIAAAPLAFALAACGANGSGASDSDGGGPSSAGVPSPTPTEETVPGAPTGLTPPGTQLSVGQKATVAWVPNSVSLASHGPQPGHKLEVTILSIKKGKIADFKDVELKPEERKSTPYYVRIRIKALAKASAGKYDDADTGLKAYDDRNQEQGGVDVIGTFEPCPEHDQPKQFTAGKSYMTCHSYLMPGGGSIQKVKWNDGPTPADGVSAYYEKPIVWTVG